MKLALQEARKGLGRTSPNPSVGAVVVRNGTVVGKGYHKKAGLPHAEPNALQDAGNKAEDATIYVTLEPCNHTGRTPPCTRAILEAGIQRVVIGMADPNPKVTGSGADFLAAQGVAVTSGVLEYECCELNRPFIKHATTGLPWVIMKAGTSMDGRIAAGIGRQTAITGPESLQRVHLLRDRVDAILVGVETAITDDPSLTTRLGGRRPGRDPERIILDTNLRLSPDAKMLHQNSQAGTWIFCGPNASKKKAQALEDVGARIERVELDAEKKLDLHAVLKILGSNQKNSVLVEGGGRVHGSFLQHGLVDEFFVFMAPIFLGEAGVALVDFDRQGVGANMPAATFMQTRRLGNDIMIHGRVR
jgi:diaminohydroxyphosphoribosylaminopyrimidine deaminase/5-amino-6-(5-phosphoribosylamino)uracil reductase